MNELSRDEREVKRVKGEREGRGRVGFSNDIILKKI